MTGEWGPLIPKKDWHWRCRVFGHKYKMFYWTSGAFLTSNRCIRCGFQAFLAL